MRRALLPAALLALLVAVALILASALARPTAEPLAGGAARVEQVDPSAYPEITLYVSVADATGQPLVGLGRGDFMLTEDGTPVDLVDFGGGEGAVSTALVVDRSGSMEDNGKIDGAQAAADAFVDLMRPGDRAALLAFNEELTLAEAFTSDQAELHAAIGGLRADGGTALYDAVVAGVELLRDTPGRRLLVVLSDGQDMRESADRDDRAYGSERTLEEAIAYAQAAGQPLVVVGLGDQAATSDDGIDEAVLEQLAGATGGRYLYAPEAAALAGLYAGLAGDVQQEYRLTYMSPRPFYDGTRRDIEVRAGASLAAGAYTERHLINVVSSPQVGLALLAPLALLLVLPALRRRRTAVGGRRAPAAGSASGPFNPAATLLDGAAATGGVAVALPTSFEPAGLPVAPAASLSHCPSCGGSLRQGARFCPTCGATRPSDPALQAERRTFCDMCGRPISAGAKFCMSCGEPVAQRGEGAAR